MHTSAMAEGDSCVAQLHDRTLGGGRRQPVAAAVEVFFIDRLHSIDERKRRGDTLSADEIRGAERAASIQLVDIHKPGAPVGPQLDAQAEVANYLRQIGDQLDKDQKLDDLLNSIAPANATKQTFYNASPCSYSLTAHSTAGRVVFAALYFAYARLRAADAGSNSSNQDNN
ncbi:PREDICTED: uncharacterized protein LOC106812472 isoform X1 [Priapulus caudatus]|uniref:Uncharacterized protein LOC106812472 isoform X1 n=1 Tax=Priapulus caudatus TaxID=37621 RepID=A0ABM1EI21_PRICU|nr:PREDICTED: uncharacterized protein LOC106812472 isoform X1 [Priapulus caudatus]